MHCVLKDRVQSVGSDKAQCNKKSLFRNLTSKTAYSIIIKWSSLQVEHGFLFINLKQK